MPNESLAERLEKILRQISVILICLWVVLLGFRPMTDNVDLGWHVAQGRWMVQHFSFYRHDLFNYPNLAHPLVDEYPFFQIILYAAWSLGWWGPCLLTAVAYGALAWLFFHAARKFNLKNSALFCFCVILMFFYLQIAFPLRPHVVTYLGIAIFGIFLLRQCDAIRWTTFWPLALLQVAWVNSHSAFVIGPAMAGLFGAEMTVRRWLIMKAFPWKTAKMWLCVFVMILLACFVNPYGWARFTLPFYQDQLESIRAYVGEMQPLTGGREALFAYIRIFTLFALVLGLIARFGATAYSFLFFAIFFYFQGQSVQKAWPVFGVFVPLIILASGAFSRTALKRPFEAWINVAGQFGTSIIAIFAVYLAVNPSMPTSLAAQWREYDHSRSELSLDATAWMKAHGIKGRLFNRCEDGGYLQQEGFDHGETYSDTGFGKYDEAFIHEVGLVNERPAHALYLINAYEPEFVVCSNFCYQWPYYLLQSDWRPVFYTPNSSVWVKSPMHSELSSVSNDEIKATFDRDLSENGQPINSTIFGRNIVALHSFGLSDFAYQKMNALPPSDHQAPWYWEAARIICFGTPQATLSIRRAFEREAESLHEDGLTAEFRAYDLNSLNDVDGALKILHAIPTHELGNYGAELMLKIELDRKDKDALALARRTDCFDLRNGRHWQYLAQAEEEFGSIDAAKVAWKKAVYYYPDDATVLTSSLAFAKKYNDGNLIHAIAESTKAYGFNRSQ